MKEGNNTADIDVNIVIKSMNDAYGSTSILIKLLLRHNSSLAALNRRRMCVGLMASFIQL